MPPFGGGGSRRNIAIQLEYRHPVWYGKTRMVSLPDGETISKISLFVLTQLTNVTDTQTDRQTDRQTHRQTPHDGIGKGKGKCKCIYIARFL